MVLVSACLTGQATRYDGDHSWSGEFLEYLYQHNLAYLALCPEVLGGLGIPRDPARIQGGRPGQEGLDVLAGRARVVTQGGRDVTRAYLQGARLVLDICRRAGVERAFLKDRSPACAYDPEGHNPRGGPGRGVLAALLEAEGIPVVEVRVQVGQGKGGEWCP